MLPTDWLNLRALHIVETLAHVNGFQAAADELGMSQSTVSHHVKKLETALGFAIFVRGNRGVELTERGSILVDEARVLLRQHHLLHQRVQEQPAEHLSIGMSEILAPRLATALLREFTEHGVSFEVTHSSVLRERVARGALDVAVAFGDGDPAHEICTVPATWWAAEGALTGTIAPYGTYQLAMFAKGCPFREAGERALAEAGVPYQPIHEVDSLAGLLGVLAAGDSVSPLPAFAVTGHEVHVVTDLPTPNPVPLYVDAASALPASIAYRLADIVPDLLENETNEHI
jgi:DNA-binding transcriptional LysR family regulator